MNMKNKASRSGFIPLKAGFTLIEILTVIAIIAIVAAILIPVAGGAKETSLKRRAQTEMQGIKVAVMQFQADHRYMPWPGAVKVGEDMWATDLATQKPVMEMLTGENPLKKIYLQIPEKSRLSAGSQVFVDPWRQPYQVGMDRNLDGAWNGKMVMEKVLVYSPGPPGKSKPMKTFDLTTH